MILLPTFAFSCQRQTRAVITAIYVMLTVCDAFLAS